MRRHILENDLLDSIVMIPDQMFYNTGIYTYIWILNNNKPKLKEETVLIINARKKFEKEPKSFGKKTNQITDINRKWINEQFANWEKNEDCKKFHTTDFAFHKVKVTFWQEDENDEQMWITEDFTTKINNANMKKAFDLYGNFTVNLKINELDFEIRYDATTAFETLVANLLKEQVTQLKEQKLNDIKKWFNNQEKTATYHHRHYIIDNEYIPFDRSKTDKEAYINSFLAKEIDYQIIDWYEYNELGYEILPNKYFYKYQEPESSDVIIDQFWTLEEEATNLLNEIKAL
jgi:type I restriction enzyme M protein